jgi:IS5 family transposase
LQKKRLPDQGVSCNAHTTERASVRIKLDPQVALTYGGSHLKATIQYFERYSSINQILLDVPAILEAFHQDAARPLERAARKRRSRFTSDHLLRAILVMDIEALTYRETSIRIDDSEFLRRFVGIHSGPAMDYSTLAKVFKAIRPETWKLINRHLADRAISEEHIEGNTLRSDTTTHETNVHYPTDSSLLWDSYRVLARLLDELRGYDGESVGDGHLQTKYVKRLALQIARRANPTESGQEKVERLYPPLLAEVSRILIWSREARTQCEVRLAKGLCGTHGICDLISPLLLQMHRFEGLTARVIDQAQRRVLGGESVPNAEKILSIFEPHTELLKLGKAAKPVEFGHMVLLSQVENKFISNYDVFEKRPSDASLVDGILADHKALFGHLPESFAADKGFYESMEKLRQLEVIIPDVSIAKKGSRNAEETAREHAATFKALQRFRAGIEGSISYLKRCFKLRRCLYRSFDTFCGSVGSHVFAHNLVVLTRL